MSENTRDCNHEMSVFFYQPLNAEKPEIISGANRRTRSNVWFGDPDLGNKYYDVTTDMTYRPCDLPDRKNPRSDLNTKSSVPTNYYGENQKSYS